MPTCPPETALAGSEHTGGVQASHGYLALIVSEGKADLTWALLFTQDTQKYKGPRSLMEKEAKPWQHLYFMNHGFQMGVTRHGCCNLNSSPQVQLCERETGIF